MAKGITLLLESGKWNAEAYADALEGRKDIKIVRTVEDAMTELRSGNVTRFRTNFINDDIDDYREALLYARDALREAVIHGIKAEVWSINDPNDILEAIGEQTPELVGKIGIFSKETAQETWFTANEGQSNPGLAATRRF